MRPRARRGKLRAWAPPLDGCSIPPHLSARKEVQRFKGRRKRANALAATRMRRLLIFLALLLVPALAQARGIEPQLVAEGPAPPGGEIELALHMRTKPGWHGYWLNPGDAGLPMEVSWQLPKGFAAGP